MLKHIELLFGVMVTTNNRWFVLDRCSDLPLFIALAKELVSVKSTTERLHPENILCSL